jgi:hypothetical protein
VAQAVGRDGLCHILLRDTIAQYCYIRREIKEKVIGENYSMHIFISIKARCVRWAGHAACMEKIGTAYKIMIRNFVGEMRPGRFKRGYGLELSAVEYGIWAGF